MEDGGWRMEDRGSRIDYLRTRIGNRGSKITITIMRRIRRGRTTTIGIRKALYLIWVQPTNVPKNKNHQNASDATEIIPEIIGAFHHLIL